MYRAVHGVHPRVVLSDPCDISHQREHCKIINPILQDNNKAILLAGYNPTLEKPPPRYCGSSVTGVI